MRNIRLVHGKEDVQSENEVEYEIGNWKLEIENKQIHEFTSSQKRNRVLIRHIP